jgi:large subunit ribosomal protein L9
MANAEVILTENIPSLGAEADIVNVRRGYARNFLIPQGKALEVNPITLRRIAQLKKKRAEREAREMTTAEELAARINKMTVRFTLETGTQGKAFGSITAKDLLDRLSSELGRELPRHAIVLERPIKESGEQKIEVNLHPDVPAKLSVIIEAANHEEPGAEEEERAPRKRTAKSAE